MRSKCDLVLRRREAPSRRTSEAAATHLARKLAAVRRILNRGDRVEHMEIDLAAILPRLVDVNVLDDVVGLGIDPELAARALNGDAVERLDERRLVRGLAAIGLERGIDELPGVITLRREFRGDAVELLLEFLLEGLVLRRVDRRHVVEHAEHAHRRIALPGEIERRDQPARPRKLDRILE